jgi:Excalibur calcium-binding domain
MGTPCLLRILTTAAAVTLTVAPMAGTADASTQAKAKIVIGGWSIPAPSATPGAVATTSAKKVCTKGYASSVRNVSTATKNKVYAEYGITSHVTYQYEIDHDISLELGGSNAITNLWPEPNDRKTSNTKDSLENKLHALVCSGQLSLKSAQKAIKGDWTKAYVTYVGTLPKYKPYHHTGTTSSSSGGSTGPDPRYSTCTEAKSHGYGPYTRGKDPEYAWYRDADGDGIVCE